VKHFNLRTADHHNTAEITPNCAKMKWLLCYLQLCTNWPFYITVLLD